MGNILGWINDRYPGNSRVPFIFLAILLGNLLLAVVFVIFQVMLCLCSDGLDGVGNVPALVRIHSYPFVPYSNWICEFNRSTYLIQPLWQLQCGYENVLKKRLVDYALIGAISFLASVLVSLYVLLVALRVAGVIDWRWSLVHIPMWIQVLTLPS